MLKQFRSASAFIRASLITLATCVPVYEASAQSSQPPSLVGGWWQVEPAIGKYMAILDLFPAGELKIQYREEDSCSKPDRARGVALHGKCYRYSITQTGHWRAEHSGSSGEGFSLCLDVKAGESSWKSGCHTFRESTYGNGRGLIADDIGTFALIDSVPPRSARKPSFSAD